MKLLKLKPLLIIGCYLLQLGIAGAANFDNDSSNHLWSTASNWSSDTLPAAGDAVIDGYDVILDRVPAESPAVLEMIDGSLTLRERGGLSLASLRIGEKLEAVVQLMLEGSNVSLRSAGGAFKLGKSATVITLPDAGGSSPLELGDGELTLEIGSEWILDGSKYRGNFALGDRFVLANYGSLSSGTGGIRTRNFDLPAIVSLNWSRRQTRSITRWWLRLLRLAPM